LCRGCGSAPSQLTPLLPCSKCSKRYHDFCFPNYKQW
jgi:hypothetical protein